MDDKVELFLMWHTRIGHPVTILCYWSKNVCVLVTFSEVHIHTQLYKRLNEPVHANTNVEVWPNSNTISFYQNDMCHTKMIRQKIDKIVL